MTIPIWFLDIDGVINSLDTPLPGDGVDPSLYATIDVTTSDGATWPITYSSKVVDFINEVSRAGLAEVRWLTTWQQDAHLCLAPAVGLDTFPAYDEPAVITHSWWKESVAREVLRDTDRAFIWTDDDLTAADGRAMQRDFDQDSVLFSPRARPGLDDRHLDAIRLFLRRLACSC